MTEDILHRNRNTNPDPNIEYTQEMYNEALVLIEDLCILISNCPLNHYGMPSPDRSANDLINSDIQREQYNTDDLATFITNNEPLMNAEQKKFMIKLCRLLLLGKAASSSWMHQAEPARHF